MAEPPAKETPERPMPEAMAASIAKQKASVRRQVAGPAGESQSTQSSSWFTTPWPREPFENIAPSAPPEAAQSSIQAPCDPLPSAEVDGLVKDASSRQGLKEDLVRAVMQRESGFRPCAVSSKGAQGLMQLMPATSAELGVRNPFDPKENVHAGARLLKQLLERYKGNLELALSAYNAGAGRVDREGAVPDIPETRDYLRNILGKLSY
ncbi:MAG: transglycosylase SLT domain-containing protein [Bryobacterales bacterium]|nr:transglycosylase SLT domain-containing protein [Bryobacterales bacterium]